MFIDLTNIEIDRKGNCLVTDVLQKCLDDIDSNGGGELVLPPGQYRTGALSLPSNLVLRLQPGAELIASEFIDDYRHITTQTSAELSQCALLYARNKSNITICGSGWINGQDECWFASKPDAVGYRMPKQERPRMLVMEECEQINLRDFTIYHSPMWTIHFACCRHLNIHNVTVDNDLYLPNTDSLDIDSCQFVKITNCTFSAADDGICLKTTRKNFGAEQKMHHIAVGNCLIRSRGAAVKIGSETFADVEDIVVSNITVFDSNRAITLVSRDGGNLRQMIFSNITYECRLCVAHHWGKAEPVALSLRYRDPTITPGIIEDIIFNNLTGSAHGAFHLYSEIQDAISNITFDTINFYQKSTEHVDYGCYDIRPPCNPAAPTGMGLDNSYSLNTKTGKPHGVERYQNGIPVFYSRGVNNLQIRHLTLRRDNPDDVVWNQEQDILQLPAQDRIKTNNPKTSETIQ